VELVVRALKDLGKNVRFIYSWDDYDVFRKVPALLPQEEELRTFLRRPITEVPDPFGKAESYARHFEIEVERILPEVGIHPEFLYQAKNYQSSKYASGIKAALQKRGELKNILDNFRDEEHKIEGEWWPVSIFCGNCRHDDTEILGWDGDWRITYRCAACGHEESVDIRTAADVKLLWRVDWPMRWEAEKVDFEPAGKDHHSQGGSFDTARLIAKEVYNYDAPVTFRYDFIGIKGKPGKMSSSKGQVVDLEDLLSVYTPPVVRYLFAGTRPNTEFTISFDLDVIKIYEDYDKTERIAFGLETAKDEEVLARERRIYELSQVDGSAAPDWSKPPFQVPFRHFCSLIQIHDGDIEAALGACEPSGSCESKDSQGGFSDEQKKPLLAKGKCALYWLQNCAPEEFLFRLRKPGEGGGLNLSEKEGAALRDLRDSVIARIEDFPDDKACAQAIYDSAARSGVDGKELFRAAYQALIGKDQGPRLASFLRIIAKERLLAILRECC
jgi:lysyl-tRNA synthetase class 1